MTEASIQNSSFSYDSSLYNSESLGGVELPDSKDAILQQFFEVVSTDMNTVDMTDAESFTKSLVDEYNNPSDLPALNFMPVDWDMTPVPEESPHRSSTAHHMIHMALHEGNNQLCHTGSMDAAPYTRSVEREMKCARLSHSGSSDDLLGFVSGEGRSDTFLAQDTVIVPTGLQAAPRTPESSHMSDEATIVDPTDPDEAPETPEFSHMLDEATVVDPTDPDEAPETPEFSRMSDETTIVDPTDPDEAPETPESSHIPDDAIVIDLTDLDEAPETPESSHIPDDAIVIDLTGPDEAPETPELHAQSEEQMSQEGGNALASTRLSSRKDVRIKSDDADSSATAKTEVKDPKSNALASAQPFPANNGSIKSDDSDSPKKPTIQMEDKKTERVHKSQEGELCDLPMSKEMPTTGVDDILAKGSRKRSLESDTFNEIPRKRTLRSLQQTSDDSDLCQVSSGFIKWGDSAHAKQQQSNVTKSLEELQTFLDEKVKADTRLIETLSSLSDVWESHITGDRETPCGHELVPKFLKELSERSDKVDSFWQTSSLTKTIKLRIAIYDPIWKTPHAVDRKDENQDKTYKGSIKKKGKC